ncbi:hypothetical protein L9F63_023315, partial [Diploptera punctata]
KVISLWASGGLWTKNHRCEMFFSIVSILRSENQDEGEEYGPDWAPLMANCGLLLISCAQCLVTIVSGFRCYRLVCPCVRSNDNNHATYGWPLPDSPEPAGSFYSTSSKELLISNWLGQQQPRPNMLLITQPPIAGPCGPIYTLPPSTGTSTLCYWLCTAKCSIFKSIDSTSFCHVTARWFPK